MYSKLSLVTLKPEKKEEYKSFKFLNLYNCFTKNQLNFENRLGQVN